MGIQLPAYQRARITIPPSLHLDTFEGPIKIPFETVLDRGTPFKTRALIGEVLIDEDQLRSIESFRDATKIAPVFKEFVRLMVLIWAEAESARVQHRVTDEDLRILKEIDPDRVPPDTWAPVGEDFVSYPSERWSSAVVPRESVDTPEAEPQTPGRH